MLNNLSIRMRLIATMSLLGLMICVTGAMANYGMRAVNSALEDVYSNQLASTLAIGNTKNLLSRARFNLDRAALHPDDADVEKTLQRAEGFIAESEKAWQQYLALPRDAEEDAMAKAVEQQRKLYINDGLLALSKAVRERNAEQIELLSMKKLQSAFGGFNAASEKLDEEQVRGARENYDSSQKLFRNMMLVSIAGGVVGIVLLALASAQLLRAILRPLNQALRHFDAMAAGDLSRAVQVESKDEMGRLLQGLSTMQQQLAATVRSVRDGSSAIASAPRKSSC